MSNQPFLPFFFGDFLAATPTWEGEERALYMLLLAYQWTSGPLPTETRRLAKMCQYEPRNFSKLWQVVGKKFIERDGGLINTRLEEHREKAKAITTHRKNAGTEGAASKWGGVASKTPGKTRSERLADARKLGRHTQDEWLGIMSVCGEKCVQCGANKSSLAGAILCKDHIVPIYAGGSDSIDNIQPMCRNCNSQKGSDQTDFRPRDWKELLAKRLAKPPSNAWDPSHPIPSDPDSDPIGSGDSADSVDRALFADARKIFGKSIGGQVNKAIKLKGKPWLLGVLESCRQKDQEAARAYFSAALNGAVPKSDADQRRCVP